MTDIIVKIMIEVLNIFAIATKEMKQGRAKKYLKRLMGRKDMDDALKRLDKLTQEEVRMAAAQILKPTQSVDDLVTGVGYTIKDMDSKMDAVLNYRKVVKEAVETLASDVDGEFCNYHLR
ncbi:hypothetical protein EDB87DRAFT_1831568 [Lactarius vividus]|nr:hypothetical protein EDB87DRAFT_1831568 [Lactarius vividus]